MSSSKKYMMFIKEQLDGLEEVIFKYMMGEYAIYYKEKVVASIFDDILLVKPVSSATKYMNEINYYQPKYLKGSKWLIVDEVEDKEYLQGLFKAIYDEVEFLIYFHN